MIIIEEAKKKAIKNRTELLTLCKELLYARVESIRFIEYSTQAMIINNEFSGINVTEGELRRLDEPTVDEESRDLQLIYKNQIANE